MFLQRFYIAWEKEIAYTRLTSKRKTAKTKHNHKNAFVAWRDRGQRLDGGQQAGYDNTVHVVVLFLNSY